MVGKSSAGLPGWKQDVFTCVGWQVILCDPMWQVTSRNTEMDFRRKAVHTFNLFYVRSRRRRPFRSKSGDGSCTNEKQRCFPVRQGVRDRCVSSGRKRENATTLTDSLTQDLRR